MPNGLRPRGAKCVSWGAAGWPSKAWEHDGRQSMMQSLGNRRRDRLQSRKKCEDADARLNSVRENSAASWQVRVDDGDPYGHVSFVGSQPIKSQPIDIARLMIEHRYHVVPPMFAKSSAKCGTKCGAVKGHCYAAHRTQSPSRRAGSSRRHPGFVSRRSRHRNAIVDAACSAPWASTRFRPRLR